MKWKIDLQYLPDRTTTILVGNKLDLEDKREVTYEEGFNYANSKGFLFTEVSAMTGIGIGLLIKIEL